MAIVGPPDSQRNLEIASPSCSVMLAGDLQARDTIPFDTIAVGSHSRSEAARNVFWW